METEVLVKDLIEPDNNIINFLLKHPVVVPSAISALSTLIIAIITCLGYNKIVVNKVNEKQLKEVINLVMDIRKKGIVTIKISQASSPDKTFNIDLIKLLTNDLIKDFKLTISDIEKYEYCEIYMEGSKAKKLVDCLQTYSNNPIIPIKVARELETLKNKLTTIKTDQTGEIRKPLTIKRTDNTSTLVIDYFTIKDSILSLVQEIKNWIKTNQVKEVNLPDSNNT